MAFITEFRRLTNKKTFKPRLMDVVACGTPAICHRCMYFFASELRFFVAIVTKARYFAPKFYTVFMLWMLFALFCHMASITAHV
jgi:hypothetical protein